MKLYLFGGAEIVPNQTGQLKTLIKKAILDCRPRAILHVPFARLKPPEEEWAEGWFKKLMGDSKIKIYDARENLNNISTKQLLVFINGGPDRQKLINTINQNKELLNLILKAEFIVGESSGSMVMGEYMRADGDNNGVIKGLGILKNTIIEPHYSERNYQKALEEDIEKSGMKYGFGIDCLTALVVNSSKFPDKWDKIGKGNIELKINSF